MTGDQLRLDAIAEATSSAERYRADIGASSPDGTMLQRFAVQVLASIGSTAARLSASLRNRHAEIPWHDIIAMRELSRPDGGADAAVLSKALNDTLPRLASHLFDLARDAAKAGAVEVESREPDSEDVGSETERNGTITLADVRKRRRDIERIAAEYGASNIRIFGSVARGEAKPYSDIDFLVDLQPGRSLLDLGGLQMDLQALFEHLVDIAHPQPGPFRDRVTAEAVSL